MAKNILKPRQVETKKDGTYCDGEYLYLRVRNNGRARAWVFRYKINGKPREIGLGRRPLKEVRDLADAMRQAVRLGKDPAPLVKPPTDGATFEKIAVDLIESKRAGWRNAKHAAQWGSTLQQYAYPILGAMAPSAIEVRHVLEVLKPVWTEKNETAVRVRRA